MMPVASLPGNLRLQPAPTAHKQVCSPKLCVCGKLGALSTDQLLLLLRVWFSYH